MKLVEMKCKNCGATLKVKNNQKDIECEYCHAQFKVDEEVQHVKYDDMEQSGYEFEKGRIRARKEHDNSFEKINYVSDVQRKKQHSIWFYLLCILFFPFVITYYVIKSTKMSTKIKIIILVVMWSILFLISIINSAEEKELEKNPWEKECTGIQDFKYLLDGDEIIISEYTGSSKKIKICDSYTIDNQNYKVTKLADKGFQSGSVKSIILPEGMVSIPSNTFNSNIKYAYIPSTIETDKKNNSFYRNFDNAEAIYYGGTEEQWKELTNHVSREKIDVKKIIYDATLEDLH